MAQVDHDLAFGVEFDVRTVHWPRRGAFEVDALGIVPAAVAGALEFVLTGLPIRRAAQVRADGRDDEDAFGVAHYPDAVLILELGVDAETEIRRIADAELGLGFVERPRKEESEKHQQVDAQRTEHRGHDKLAAARDDRTFVAYFVLIENVA